MSESGMESRGQSIPNAPKTKNAHGWERLKLSAPKSDNTLFAKPNLDAAKNVVATNSDLLGGMNFSVQGRSLQTLRQRARLAVLDAAKSYTSLLRDQPVEVVGNDDRKFIVSGHQPALFLSLIHI